MDERCVARLEANLESLEKELAALKDNQTHYITRDEMRDTLTAVNSSINANHTVVMGLLVPLHENNLKSKGFINGMLFVVTAITSVIVLIITYVLDHLKT